jgi:hypothetical protein
VAKASDSCFRLLCWQKTKTTEFKTNRTGPLLGDDPAMNKHEKVNKTTGNKTQTNLMVPSNPIWAGNLRRNPARMSNQNQTTTCFSQGNWQPQSQRHRRCHGIPLLPVLPQPTSPEHA